MKTTNTSTGSERYARIIRATVKFTGLAFCWLSIISLAFYAFDGLLRDNQGDADAHAFMVYQTVGVVLYFIVGRLFIDMSNDINPELPDMNPAWEII